MPNHVTHRVVLISQERIRLESFRNAFFVMDEEHLCFDFNTITPMPAILRDSESSSAIGLGLAMLGRADIPSGFGGTRSLEDWLVTPYYQGHGVSTIEDLARFIMDREPDCIDLAKRAVKAFEETGHTDWYTWSKKHWGTKWGAYSFDAGEIEQREDGSFRLEFRFDTAWSPPEPIFTALAKRPEMNGVDLAVLAFDEGWNFAWGAGIQNGVFQSAEFPACDEIHNLVYGTEDGETLPAAIDKILQIAAE